MSLTSVQEIDELILSYLQLNDVYQLQNTALYDIKLATSTSDTAKYYFLTRTNDLKRLKTIPHPEMPLQQRIYKTAIEYAHPDIFRYLVKLSPPFIDYYQEFFLQATHLDKPEHIRILLKMFKNYDNQHELYYLQSTLFTTFDYCFNAAYRAKNYEIVDIFIEDAYTKSILEYITPKFKELYKSLKALKK